MRLFGVLVSMLVVAVACGGGAVAPVATGPTSPTPATTPASPSPAPATVRVAHAPSTLFAPLYIAIEKGYFARQGITVQLETVRAGQDAVALTATGQVDALVAGFSAAMFNALGRGLEFKVVGAMGATPADGTAPTALMVAQSLRGEIKTVADLKGRKVALSGGLGAAGGFQADVMLSAGGISAKDVQAVNIGFPDMAQALKTGAVAAAVVPAPFTTAMQTSGVAAILAQPPIGLTSTGVIFGKTFSGTPAAQRFFNALVLAARDLQGDRKRSPENLAAISKVTGADVTQLTTQALYDWNANLAPDIASLERMQTTYRALGLLDYPQNKPTTEYVDASFSQKAAVAIR